MSKNDYAGKYIHDILPLHHNLKVVLMRFEKVKKENKIQRLINKFLESEYDQVEVFNEDDYVDNARMSAALRFVIKNHYDGVVTVSRTNDRVFLYKASQNEPE